MCLKRNRSCIFFAPILQQWRYVALVVDFYGLLGRGWVRARRRRLEDEAIDCRENEEFADQTRHVVLIGSLQLGKPRAIMVDDTA